MLLKILMSKKIEFQRTYFTLGVEVAAFGGPDWQQSTSGVGRQDGKYGPTSGRNNERGSPVAPESLRHVRTEGEFAMFSISILRGHYEAGCFDVNNEFTAGMHIVNNLLFVIIFIN